MPPPQTTSEYVVIYLITQLLLTAHVTCVKRVKLTADVSTIININITTYNTYNPAPNYYHCNNYIITNKKREAMKSKIVPPPPFFFFFTVFFTLFFLHPSGCSSPWNASQVKKSRSSNTHSFME